MFEHEQKSKQKPAKINGAGSKALQLKDNRESPIQQQKANNTGLPDQLKSGMENLSGVSLDHVQVHYNSAKPATVQAHAYAQGNQIHLGPGQERHLPHELGHVVQQAQGRVQPTTNINGVAVNDNPGLEKEADNMGNKAMQMKVDEGKVKQLKPNVSNLVQRKVVQLGKGKRLTEAEKRAKNWDDDATRVKKIDAKQREATRTKKGQVIEVPSGSKEFNQVKQQVEQNVRNKPYKTDAFHETQPLMQGIMGAQGFWGKLWAGKSAVLPGGGGNEFTVKITKVYRIINPAQRVTAFQKAKLVPGKQPNKKVETLYAGHGAVTTGHIIDGGYRPDMGAHDTQKGFGALGRGAYFSDQAAKAATYGGVDPVHGGTLIVSDVITGKQKVVVDGSSERHKTHNSMVKRTAGTNNQTIPVPNGYAGTDGKEDESQYDSIKGQKSYESGAGTYGALWNRNVFDSNEILVRNADQVLPKYKVDYKVEFH